MGGTNRREPCRRRTLSLKLIDIIAGKCYLAGMLNNVRQAQFPSFLDDSPSAAFERANKVWSELFAQNNRKYVPPELRLLNENIADIQVSYHRDEQSIYLNERYLEWLDAQLNLNGSFYTDLILTHEVCHHVQYLEGKYLDVKNGGSAVWQEATEQQQCAMERECEDNADYLSGVWAHHADKMYPGLIEPNDLIDAVNFLHTIGADYSTAGTVDPSLFTHGTSQKREESFFEGYESGSPCLF